MEWTLELLLLLLSAGVVCPSALSLILNLRLDFLLVGEVAVADLLVLTQCLLLIQCLLLMDCCLDNSMDCCHPLDWEDLQRDLLFLLPLAWCAEASTELDMNLHLELQWHAELVGVVVVVVECIYLFLFDLPELVIVLGRLDLAELLLEPVLRSAGGLWMAVRLLHCSDESDSH